MSIDTNKSRECCIRFLTGQFLDIKKFIFIGFSRLKGPHGGGIIFRRDYFFAELDYACLLEERRTNNNYLAKFDLYWGKFFANMIPDSISKFNVCLRK